MHKLWLALLLCSSAFGMEKLDPKYQVGFGDPTSDIQVVEYYSLSCPKCIDLFEAEFAGLRKAYPDVHFVFHPDPADLLTLQEMVCLERLSPEQKPLFLETVLECVAENKGKGGCRILQAAMDALGHPLPELDNIEFLETTDAYKKAFEFLIQEDVVKTIPAYEINGTFFDELPSRTSIESNILLLRTV